MASKGFQIIVWTKCLVWKEQEECFRKHCSLMVNVLYCRTESLWVEAILHLENMLCITSGYLIYHREQKKRVVDNFLHAMH